MKKLVLLIAAMAISGCGHGWYWRSPITNEPPIVLHPIEKTDIFEIPIGAKITWDTTPEMEGAVEFTKKEGWFVSDFYMKEVLDAQVAEK